MINKIFFHKSINIVNVIYFNDDKECHLSNACKNFYLHVKLKHRFR